MSNLGSNIGYVDELYARFLEDPDSVSEAWREFFADYRPGAAAARPVTLPEAPAPAAREIRPPAPAPAPAPGPAEAEVEAEPLRGIAGKIVENMTSSLAVPTATSARSIPVKLLEENRRVVNQHQALTASPRISFTHLIAWAIVRAIEKHPSMNAGFTEIDGFPHRTRRRAIHLGLAIDVERRGERVLLVPNLKDAASLDFPSFVAAYDDLVVRARANKLQVEDFQGTTVSLTNPGMLGTALSVPRLMEGQGTIVGTGNIGYPAEYAGMAPEVISELGLSKVMTVTSTYDHRIIQGAESGAFLAYLEKLLLGEDGFYERIFRELNVPHEPVMWAADRNPGLFTAAGTTEAIEKQARVLQLIRYYRVRGHLWADLDPLGYEPEPHPELELSSYGLSVWDMDRKFIAGRLGGHEGTLPLREILDVLRDTYCRHIGVEYMHIPESDVRHWLQERMERTRNAEPIPADQQARILLKLNAAEAFEKFLHTTYVGHKRFSLEGGETLIPMLDALLNEAAGAGIEEAVIGMAHRGRLNVLTNIVGKSYDQVFREFEGTIDPSSAHGSGDVKYHLGAAGEHETPDGRKVGLAVASNPSHLEAVDPVVEGMARARQDRRGDLSREKVLPILIHGDAAFAGQGVVGETFNLSQLRGYRTGGTLHIVVNNQIGFTTRPVDARSSMYATDVAKMVRAPILHVNGDHPEAAVRAIRLALAFRQEFRKDIVVDLVCYRRWGHNESDDPSYTNPILYAKIEAHRSVRKLYTEALLRRGDLDVEAAERMLEDYRSRLESAFAEVKRAQQESLDGPRPDFEAMDLESRPDVDTPVAPALLEEILDGLGRVSGDFRIHPKLGKQLDRRRGQYESGKIDWALAEALSFGSLALEGTPVRLSGQDSGRATFSQRHAILYDHRTAAPYTPLANLGPDQAPFQVFDSLLSEFAVLGFEYGYSVDHPEALVIWEAQFGDFVNGAQIVIDQFIASAEQKWGQKSGLVMLLPHGYEGQGPEHSSCRVERFLQLCARGNLQVAVPSTPAQYFHLLRRQVRMEARKPLVILTPKSLLRHQDAVSAAEELSGGAFREVLLPDGPKNEPAGISRLVLCSGKVYYDLLAHLRDSKLDGVTLARVEQLYPWPADDVRELLARYDSVLEVVWCQEEPKNMGAWDFLKERLIAALGPGQTLRYAGRPRSASPATGSYKQHLAEQNALVREALEGLAVPSEGAVSAPGRTARS
jgi:multifunctional 2-oxoglutarate metabolism enzyme